MSIKVKQKNIFYVAIVLLFVLYCCLINIIIKAKVTNDNIKNSNSTIIQRPIRMI